MNEHSQVFSRVVLALIGQNQRMGQALTGLTALNAVLLREICLLHGKPLDHFQKLEAQLETMGKSLAGNTEDTVDVVDIPGGLTEIIEQTLREGRDLLKQVQRQ